LFMAHNLERIADRTTNIAERIVFMISGQLIELNP
jgi:phosphate transport system protein